MYYLDAPHPLRSQASNTTTLPSRLKDMLPFGMLRTPHGAREILQGTVVALTLDGSLHHARMEHRATRIGRYITLAFVQA